MPDHLVGGLHCADATELAAAFVLDALEPSQMDAVREHLAGCPETHAEFAELAAVVPALLDTVELIAPPPGLGARVRAAAESERAAANQPSAAMPPVAETRAPQTVLSLMPRPAATPVDVPSRGAGGWSPGIFRRPVWAAVSLAAALAVAVLGVWNLQLRDQVNDLSTYRNGVAAVLGEAAQPGAQLAVLSTPAGANGPSGFAAVGSDGSVALVVHELAPTSGAQVYEAWLIAGSGAPVPIGGFAVGTGGAATLTTSHPSLGAGVTVALTLEPGPGATTPTLPIVAAGKAAGASS